jgi:hypothetical protein
MSTSISESIKESAKTGTYGIWVVNVREKLEYKEDPRLVDFFKTNILLSCWVLLPSWFLHMSLISFSAWPYEAGVD